jgi:phenylpropionate dioxygenase-like ring-hydroxylating dioxygenase large terminal subunit
MDGTGIIADAGGVYGGVADDAAQARGLPGRAYSDPAVFEAEVERVFTAGWLAVARESQVASPGDYLAADPAGVPVLVTRDAEGGVHVLSRICRHRGMPVAEGAGNAKALMCPYHLWRYGLDGALLSAPAMDGSQAFDAPSCGLRAIRHETWGGWIFANLDGRAAPLGPQVAPLTARVAAYGLERFVTADVITFESPWNWKVMIENFMESYHHIGPHAGTLQKTNPGLGTHPGECGDAFAILENPPVGPQEGALLVAAIFPTTLLFVAEREPVVAGWYELADIVHDRFTLRIHILADPELARTPWFVEAVRARSTEIHLEDIRVCEGVQKGVTSPLYEPGPLSPLEGCLWRFHRHLRACFSGGAR